MLNSAGICFSHTPTHDLKLFLLQCIISDGYIDITVYDCSVEFASSHFVCWSFPFFYMILILVSPHRSKEFQQNISSICIPVLTLGKLERRSTQIIHRHFLLLKKFTLSSNVPFTVKDRDIYLWLQERYFFKGETCNDFCWWIDVLHSKNQFYIDCFFVKSFLVV